MGAAEPQAGFQFDLCRRNAFLEDRGVHAPRLTKTGTTIAGIIFKASPLSSLWASCCLQLWAFLCCAWLSLLQGSQCAC